MNAICPTFAPSRDGFTLVELMVVIAILGILTTIIAPNLREGRARARGTACLSNLRQIYFRIQPHLERYGEFPHLLNRASRSDPVPTLDSEFADPSSHNRIYRCPADRTPLFEESGTSYFWNYLVNGQPPHRIRLLTQRLSGHNVPVVADKEGFHPHLDDQVNILYADGHVAPGLMDCLQAP